MNNNLRDASAKSHALEELVEGEGNDQWLYRVGAFRSPERYPNDQRVHHDSKLQNLRDKPLHQKLEDKKEEETPSTETKNFKVKRTFNERTCDIMRCRTSSDMLVA